MENNEFHGNMHYKNNLELTALNYFSNTNMGKSTERVSLELGLRVPREAEGGASPCQAGKVKEQREGV